MTPEHVVEIWWDDADYWDCCDCVEAVPNGIGGIECTVADYRTCPVVEKKMAELMEYMGCKK